MFKGPSSVQVSKSVLVKTMSYFTVENIISDTARDRCMSKLKNMPIADLGIPLADKKAAVLVPLCVDNGKISLLYTLRSMSLSSHKGHVSFPGGKFDSTDVSLTATALRETEEELGIPRDMVNIWGEIGALPSKNFEMAVTPIIGFVKDFNKINLQTNPSEVEEAFTVSLEVLSDPQYFGFNKFKNGFTLPVFMGGNHKIWGLTAIITHFLLSNLLPLEAYSMQNSYLNAPYVRNDAKSEV